MATIDNIITPSYTTKDTFNSNRECINYYVEAAPQGKWQYTLQPTPGLTSFAVTDGTRLRALINYNETLYGVSSDKFFRCSSDGTVTNLGTLESSLENVDIAAVKDQIMIVDGVQGYIYIISTNTFQTITDLDFPVGPNSVTANNGRFIVEEPLTERFWWSDLRDGLTWDGLSFASAENKTDDVLAVHSTGMYLVIMGRENSEIWQNVGGLDVFSPVSGTYIDYGIMAIRSVAQIGSSIFALVQNDKGQGEVIQTINFDVSVISTPAVTYQLSQYEVLDDAKGFAFQLNGHIFYALTFPTADVTWLYDSVTGLWSKWLSWNGISDGRHKSNCYAFCYGKHLVGDFQSGSIYQLDTENYTDGGTRIRREVIFPFPTDENKRVSIYNFQISFEKGSGLTTGQGSDPTVMFQFSKDAGHTWGGERHRPISKLGDYLPRAFWGMIGQGAQPYGKISITDPIFVPILGATASLSSEDGDF